MAFKSHEILSVSGLSAKWGTDKVPVLQDISLSLFSGEFVCLSGPNGSGKSTLMSLLAGIVPAGLEVSFIESDKGTETGTDCGVQKGAFNDGGAAQAHGVTFKDENLKNFTRKQLASKIAYLSQSEHSAWDYRVEDIVLSGRFCHTGANCAYSKQDYEAVEKALEKVGMLPFVNRRIQSLSGGEWQKVRIARSLAQEPEVLILDEPVANLDFSYQNEILTLLVDIAHSKRTLVLVSIHDINLAARFADKLLLLKKLSNDRSLDIKQLYTGTPMELLKSEVLESVYGGKFESFIHPGYGCPQVYSF